MNFAIKWLSYTNSNIIRGSDIYAYIVHRSLEINPFVFIKIFHHTRARHVVAVELDQAGVPQMRKLCDLFFINWIKKTSFQNEYYGVTYKQNLLVCQ